MPQESSSWLLLRLHWHPGLPGSQLDDVFDKTGMSIFKGVKAI
jgi:hypothetical protein